MAVKKLSVCPQCGCSFQWIWGEMKGRKGCCSVECFRAKERYRNKKIDWNKYSAPVPKRVQSCEQCGEKFTARKRKYCSAKCRVIARERRLSAYRPPTEEISCKECGASFLPKRDTGKYCCADCGNKSKWRAATVRRRARLRNCESENFDPFEIFERDKWRCYLCGVRVLKSLRGTRQDRAPELDHIIPLSKGGDHLRTNVACSCRRCNQTKRDMPLGQLRLVG